LKEQFAINTNAAFESFDCTLTMILGDDYFSYAINDNENTVQELRRYYLQKTTVSQLDEIFESNPVLNKGFANIITALDFNTNVLLPVDENTGDNTPLLYLNGAEHQDHIINEVVEKWDLANVYSIPYELLYWILKHFPSTKLWHAQSMYLKMAGKGFADGCIDLDLRDTNFNVTVTQLNKLLLGKNYSYATPADVLFYLLKICECFQLNQKDVQLNISGLVDKNSTLYKTLYDYFLNINLRPASWKFDQYPAHYFTLLNQLALCE
jgi:hypothetical protein